MRILHYIPYNFHSIDINKEYKSMLLHDVYSSDEYAIAENYSDFKQKAEKMKPEIIHIHACWNISAYRVQHWAIKHPSSPSTEAPSAHRLSAQGHQECRCCSHLNQYRTSENGEDWMEHTQLKDCECIDNQWCK